MKAWQWGRRSSGHCMPLGVADVSVKRSGSDRPIITLARGMACLDLAWGQASLYGLALGFVVYYDLMVVASLSSQTRGCGGVFEGGGSLFNELCYKCLGKYLWCIHSLSENVISLERQVFVMLVLLADILTSNSQCMRTSLRIRTEGN